MIEYVKGDGQKIIVSVYNDLEKWCKGVVPAISRHWDELDYWYRHPALCVRIPCIKRG